MMRAISNVHAGRRFPTPGLGVSHRLNPALPWVLQFVCSNYISVCCISCHKRRRNNHNYLAPHVLFCLSWSKLREMMC